MRNKVCALFLAFATLLASAPTVSAQAMRADWSAVQVIQPGTELVLELKSGGSVKGKLSNVSDSRIVLTSKKKNVEVDRQDVRRVYRKKGRSLGKSTLIGLGLGAGVGAAVGGVVAATDGPAESGEEYMPVWWLGLVGAGFGALGGFLFGFKRGRVLVYEAP